MSAPRILFIAPTRIGDAVLATSILRHILATVPDARVTIATSPLAAPLYEGYPLVDRIIRVTKRTYNRHWLTVWRETVGTHWDAVWDMRGSILSFIVRARARHYYVSQKIAAPKVKQYEAAFGIRNLPFPTLWPRPADETAAERIIPSGGRYLVLAPIANWAPKEWPMDHFIALAQQLLNGACNGYRPVIICAGHERPKAQLLLEALAHFSPIDLTAGVEPLLTIFACMQRSHGFIGNDSGLMHMAAAANIPTLGLFGPTPQTIYQPWGEQASYVQAPGGDLSALAPEVVAEAFAQRITSQR